MNLRVSQDPTAGTYLSAGVELGLKSAAADAARLVLR